MNINKRLRKINRNLQEVAHKIEIAGWDAVDPRWIKWMKKVDDKKLKEILKDTAYIRNNDRGMDGMKAYEELKHIVEELDKRGLKYRRPRGF